MLIDGARAVPTVSKMVGSFIAGTAGELVNFGKVANASPTSWPTLATQRQQRSALQKEGPSAKKDDRRGRRRFRPDGGDFPRRVIPSSSRRTVRARGCHEGQRKGRRDRSQSLWMTTRTQPTGRRIRRKQQPQPRALRMALVGLEQKNIQIAFEIDQDKIKSDIAALEDLFHASVAKTLPTRSRRYRRRQRIGPAENVQTRYTALVNALNAEAKRINAMPQDGERDRAPEKHVKNTKSSAHWRKELAGIEGKRNEDTRNATNRIRQQIKEMEDGYKTVWRGLDDYVNSLADAQAERALNRHDDRPHEGGAGPVTIAARDGA